jgi:hypothetical protein
MLEKNCMTRDKSANPGQLNSAPIINFLPTQQNYAQLLYEQQG